MQRPAKGVPIVDRAAERGEIVERLESFLESVPFFEELQKKDVRQMIPYLREQSFRAGDRILIQGEPSQSIYMVRSGRLAVRVNRQDGRETVAYLQPPAVFGELSFLTGRPCSADVEVVIDADVVALGKDSLHRLPDRGDSILRGLTTILAERLHDTVTGGGRVAETPTVVLSSGRNWGAPFAFAQALAKSLGDQTGNETLVIHLGTDAAEELTEVGARVNRIAIPVDDAANARKQVIDSLDRWKPHFVNIILNPVGPLSSGILEQASDFADYSGALLGPGDPLPEFSKPRQFIVQDASHPTLPALSGHRQLITGVKEAEERNRLDRAPGRDFQRTVDSIARYVANLQVGVALGGGAAWGWAHAGVLSVLEEAGLPIDVISGCSMGSVVGSLYCSGRNAAQIREIADYWRTRTLRFIEPRFWRFQLIREGAVSSAFDSYFGDRTINQLDFPFWANAVDIQSGRECTLKDGRVSDTLRSSIALPGLFPPVRRQGMLLVDAGIMNPVPVRLVRDMGAAYALAINAMVPLEAQEVSRRYPFSILDVMFRCMRVTGHEIGQARIESAADIVIFPRLEKLSMLQFSRAPEMIQAGEEAAREHLPMIEAGYRNLKKSVRQRQVN